jgi:myotubularin-related protein 1/2
MMTTRRSIADEKLVAALCASQRPSSMNTKLIYIADARPRKNAFANGAMGYGGTESSSNYSQSEVVFLGIDNVHVVRDSFSRLRDYLDTHGSVSSDGLSSYHRNGGWNWGGGNVSV